ncbi:hypothetical protein ACFLS9_07640 [Bacteroidota bacterium]
MDSIEIKQVRSNSDLKKFIKFPWKIYKNDPYWVPHLIYDRKKLLNKKKNPFFKHSEMELFLAIENGEILGRIAAIKNDLHNEVHNESVGFFGFFESVNKQEIANKLLDTAKDWIKSKNLSIMRGPANPSSNDEWGLLIDGFDDSPRLMMTYNPKYYIDLFNNYGLKKAKDLYAYKLETEKVYSSEKLKRVTDIAKRRSGIKIRSLNMKDFQNELNRVKMLYNAAWEPNWGFIPFTEEEIDTAAKDLKMLIDPYLVLFGEIEDKLVGFALVIRDYNYIFKKMNGRLLPFNFLKLHTQKKNIPWVRVFMLGIIPKYQKRGLDAVFYYEITKRAAEKGILQGEASWVLEDNEMMNRGAQVMNGEIYKKYRIYEIET